MIRIFCTVRVLHLHRVTFGIFPKFILKHRLYPEEILNLEGLLVTANLNL